VNVFGDYSDSNQSRWSHPRFWPGFELADPAIFSDPVINRIVDTSSENTELIWDEPSFKSADSATSPNQAISSIAASALGNTAVDLGSKRGRRREFSIWTDDMDETYRNLHLYYKKLECTGLEKNSAIVSRMKEAYKTELGPIDNVIVAKMCSNAADRQRRAKAKADSAATLKQEKKGKTNNHEEWSEDVDKTFRTLYLKDMHAGGDHKKRFLRILPEMEKAHIELDGKDPKIVKEMFLEASKKFNEQRRVERKRAKASETFAVALGTKRKETSSSHDIEESEPPNTQKKRRPRTIYKQWTPQMKATFVEIETGFTGWGRFKKMIPTMIVRHPELVSEKSATIEAMLLLASKNLSAARAQGIVEMRPITSSETEIEVAPPIDDDGDEYFTEAVIGLKRPLLH